ncbi:hypothetical protein [Sphingosinithalassobacter sp. LHW66-3]|uniref:hypothetical protein n=1 Tax=Sphingosinithalassobacter sp. LHW66-3 TaxID=3424718 RepID=UPI003D6B7B21
MSPEEARAALAQVQQTDQRMATRMRWPFRRHAMFGLCEALIVGGIGTGHPVGIAAMGAGCALTAVLILDDKKRHGMFVSGLQGRRTWPALAIAVILALAGVIGALALRDAEGVDPRVLAIAAVVWAGCTAASLWWERLYRAELASGAAQ